LVSAASASSSDCADSNQGVGVTLSEEKGHGRSRITTSPGQVVSLASLNIGREVGEGDLSAGVRGKQRDADDGLEHEHGEAREFLGSS